MQCSGERMRGGQTNWTTGQTATTAVVQLVKQSLTGYEFHNLLVFLDVCHWALNDHFNALNILTTYLGSILILPSHLHTAHQSDIPLSRFQTKVFNAFLICNTGDTFSTYLNCLHLTILTICGEDYQFTGFSPRVTEKRKDQENKPAILLASCSSVLTWTLILKAHTMGICKEGAGLYV